MNKRLREGTDAVVPGACAREADWVLKQGVTRPDHLKVMGLFLPLRAVCSNVQTGYRAEQKDG